MSIFFTSISANTNRVWFYPILNCFKLGCTTFGLHRATLAVARLFKERNMRTHFHIFAISSLLCAVLITGGLDLGFQAHTDAHIALKLLVKGQSIGLILGLAILLAALITLSVLRFWLRPLQKLELEITTITDNPEQILPPPETRNTPLPILQTRQQLHSLRQKVRQSIRQRQRLADVGEAVAKINHDLRNMLASILLVTDQLESSEDPKVAQVAPIVIRATEQATELCQNMLDYLSELPAPAPERLNMQVVIEELSATTDIQLQYSGPDTLVTDRLMLYRIFLNLLRNAQDAGAKQMIIDIWRAGHLAVIDISDNGPGIDIQIRDRIFSAFTSGRSSHIGLGLAICLDLALALEGRLSLSRSSDEGCAFRLQLPAGILSAD